MIYVKEYDCSKDSRGIEYIGLTTFDDEAEAFAYAEEQKKKEIYCDIYDEAYMLSSTFPLAIPKEVTEDAIAEVGRFLEG